MKNSVVPESLGISSQSCYANKEWIQLKLTTKEIAKTLNLASGLEMLFYFMCFFGVAPDFCLQSWIIPTEIQITDIGGEERENIAFHPLGQ